VLGGSRANSSEGACVQTERGCFCCTPAHEQQSKFIFVCAPKVGCGLFACGVGVGGERGNCRLLLPIWGPCEERGERFIFVAFHVKHAANVYSCAAGRLVVVGNIQTVCTRVSEAGRVRQGAGGGCCLCEQGVQILQSWNVSVVGDAP